MMVLLRQMRRLLFSLLLLPGITSAQSPSDSLQILKWLEQGASFYQQHRSFPQLLDYVSGLQKDVPYKSGLLEKAGNESLVVTTEGYDCVIFVEMTLALALSISHDQINIDAVNRWLQLFRYRNGNIDGYESRNHYFTDWLLENENAGRIQLLGQNYSGSQPLQRIYFMSQKSHLYPKLKEEPELIPEILKREQEINHAGIRYIPTELISDFESEVQPGDLVAFVTSIRGLDVSHTGIVTKSGERTTFWHASTKGRVMLEPLTLAQYVEDNSSMIGVICARPLFRPIPSE